MHIAKTFKNGNFTEGHNFPDFQTAKKLDYKHLLKITFLFILDKASKIICISREHSKKHTRS